MGKHTKKEDMTLRDWFAGMAIQEFIKYYDGDDVNNDYLAQSAYSIADEMIFERKKERRHR